MLPNGIAGILSTVERVRRFSAYVQNLCAPGQRYRHAICGDGRCCIGVVETESSSRYMSLEQRTGQGIAACDGFCFTPSRLPSTPTALHAGDLRLPDEANGMFAAASYDGISLRLLTDAWSSIPMYFREIDDGWAFGAQLRLLRNVPGISAPEFDRRGVAQFLCWNTILDGSTLYEGIRKLGGAGFVEIGPGGVTGARYWQPQVRPSERGDCLDASVDAFIRAVDRCREALPGRHAAALSGGLDSRVIWSALGPGAGMPAFTHAIAMGHDAQIASMVARKLGVQHHLVTIGEGFQASLQTHFSAMISGTNGMLRANNAHLPFVYAEYQRHADVLWDGNHSSIEGRWALRTTARRIRSRTDFVEQLWNMLHVPGLEGVSEFFSATDAKEAARAVLEELAGDPADSASPGCAADEFNVRWIVPNHGVDAALLQNASLRYVSPYLDLDYVDAVSNVPEADRWRQLPQREVIRRCAPDLVRIPRSYRDIRTLPSRNPYVQLLPVAWHRLVLPRIRPFMPGPVLRAFDPSSGSMPYGDILHELTNHLLRDPGALPEVLRAEAVEQLSRSALGHAALAQLPVLLHPEGPLSS